jgi:heme/copper-type cytochrome/quinol oxidase subunit 2
VVPFPARYVIEVTGSNNLWHVRYPDPADRTRPAKLMKGVRNIRVPLGTRVVLLLKSRDYLYTLAIPDYGLKEIAVPGCEFRMELRPRAAGRLELIGEHLCGDPFAEISGQLVVEPQDRFRSWLRQ